MSTKRWPLWGAGVLLFVLTALVVALFKDNEVESSSTACAPPPRASSATFTTSTAADSPRPLLEGFKRALASAAPAGRLMTVEEKEEYRARVERWRSPLVHTRLPPPDPDAPVTFVSPGEGESDEVIQEAIARIKAFFVEADLSDEQQRQFLELLRDYQYLHDVAFVHMIDGGGIDTGYESADLLFAVELSIEEDLPIAAARFLTENQQQILARTIQPYVTTVTTTGMVGTRWREAFREPTVAGR
jgi:hypothetical protein